jgi:hypothetical protein
MGLYYSQYFGISHKSFVDKKVFDGCLDVDSPFHIYPLLLKNCEIPEFVNAYQEFLDYFKLFYHLVPHVRFRNEKDRYYKQIVKGFTFPEMANTGLGFSKSKNKGSGISGSISFQLAECAIDIISAGHMDPEIFVLMPLFEDNIGADRISDMAIAILRKRFYDYTARIAAELKIETIKYRSNLTNETIDLPSYNQKPILFVPEVLLADLPIATSFEEIDEAANYYNELKKKISEIIGANWKEYHEYKKSQWKELILGNERCYLAAVNYYKNLNGISYDFNVDKKDNYLSVRLQEVVDKHPLDIIQFLDYNNPKNIYDIVFKILHQFKNLVENNYMWKIFNRRDRTPDETDWQLYLYSIADTYIKGAKADIDITRENDPGVGELDFKFTRGTKGKTVVEIKRSSNKDLLHGYASQLQKYMKAEAAEFGIFLIIKEEDKHETNIQNVFNHRTYLLANSTYAPDIIIVDARPISSASKV